MTTTDTSTVAVRRPSLVTVRAIPARMLLGALVAVSFVVRMFAAIAHPSPRLFPDEYIYFTLGRSLSHGSLTIRGQGAHFPALLEPLLASPLWLVGGRDVELVYRLTQGMHALVVSLVAVPVFVLARRVGARDWQALACSAFALALPTLVYASFITADAVSLTFAVGAVAAGAAALERPTARSQIAFLAFAGLATLGRIQYVVLPVAFIVGTLIIERGRLRSVLSSYRMTLALIVLPLVGVTALGPHRVLGYYGAVTSLKLRPAGLLHWLLTDSFLLGYAAGWVLAPLALAGLVLALVRPRDRAELSFAAFTAPLLVLLLAEAAVYASNGSDRFQERYLMALLPLVPILFLIGAARLHLVGVRRAVAGVSVGFFILAAVIPLSPYTVLTSKQDSPTLQGVYQIEQALGYGNGSLAVGIGVGVLSLMGAGLVLRGRHAIAPLFVLAIGVLVAACVADHAYDTSRARAALRTFAQPELVDGHRMGKVSVLQTPYSSRPQISAQLFWNLSLTRILQMRNSSDVDLFGSTRVQIARDGRVVAHGAAVTDPLLVEEYASYARLDDAELVERTIDTSLWKPVGTPSLAVLTAGRYFDGWFGSFADVTVWPKATGPRRGVMRLSFTLPADTRPSTLDVTAPGIHRVVRVRPGATQTVALPAVVRRPWRVHIRTRQPFVTSDGRFVSVQGSAPDFVEKP